MYYICIPHRSTSIYKTTAHDHKGKNDNSTIIVGDFKTPLTALDRLSRQKIRKQALNDALDQMDLIDIYRTFHLKKAEYTFFSDAQGTFSRMDHILATNQASVNVRKLKSYQAPFLTITL